VRICFLTHYFPPEAGAPQTRIDLLARTLAARGDAVTVHTGFPHYPSGEIPDPYRNRPWQRERRDGITIVRSAVYPAANRGFGRRLTDHAAFGLSALATAALSGPADVVVGETPPLFTAAAGVAYAAGKRAAYVVNVADRWPESAVQLGALRNRRAIAAATSLERFTYRHADLVTAPTQGIVDALQSVPEGGSKARRLWPVVDLSRFGARPTTSPDRGGRPLRLLYAGTVGLAQDLEVLVRASKLAGADVVQTTIVGDGADAERLREVIAEQRVHNVAMLGPIAAARVPGLYAEADAAAVLLRDLPIFAGALPTKLLEAMAAATPVLLGARGESAELVGSAGAGVVVAPGSVSALADGIRALAADPASRLKLGRAGRAYAELHFGADRAAEAWTAALTDAVAAHRAVSNRRR
jgi:glycosyltransferase involved in cell wall biosynthesis